MKDSIPAIIILAVTISWFVWLFGILKPRISQSFESCMSNQPDKMDIKTRVWWRGRYIYYRSTYYADYCVPISVADSVAKEELKLAEQFIEQYRKMP